MPAIKTIIDKLRIEYEGLFSMPDLYATIDNWLKEKGYDKQEKKNVERVKAAGKDVELLLQPWKKITDYAKIVINIRVIASNIKEVEVEQDGAKIKLNQGKVHIVLDGWLQTDYEGRWEGKPLFFFLRELYDRYLYKPYTSSYESAVAKDTTDLHGELRSFLNLYRYK